MCVHCNAPLWVEVGTLVEHSNCSTFVQSFAEGQHAGEMHLQRQTCLRYFKVAFEEGKFYTKPVHSIQVGQQGQEGQEGLYEENERQGITKC